MFFSRAPEIPYHRYIHRRVTSSTENPYKFSHARTALKFGLQALEIQKKQEILVPGFICDVVLLPLNELGIIPVYYDIDDAFEPDWKSISSCINSKTKAVLMVHYFGQPQDILKFQRLCKEYKIWLIEDNAHGFGGLLGDHFLGTFGDIGITSPRKSLPILNGAYLYLKNQKSISFPKELELEPVIPVYRAFKQILKRIIRGYCVFRNLNIGKLRYDSQNVLRESIKQEWGMDDTTDLIMSGLDLAEIAKKRRSIYSLWYEWSISQGLKPAVKQLLPGISPLSFPAYTSSFEESRRWYDWGYKEGIEIHSWPTMPEAVVRNNHSAMKIWQRLICFPIHQEMNFQMLHDKLKKISFQ